MQQLTPQFGSHEVRNSSFASSQTHSLYMHTEVSVHTLSLTRGSHRPVMCGSPSFHLRRVVCGTSHSPSIELSLVHMHDVGRVPVRDALVLTLARDATRFLAATPHKWQLATPNGHSAPRTIALVIPHQQHHSPEPPLSSCARPRMCSYPLRTPYPPRRGTCASASLVSLSLLCAFSRPQTLI